MRKYQKIAQFKQLKNYFFTVYFFVFELNRKLVNFLGESKTRMLAELFSEFKTEKHHLKFNVMHLKLFHFNELHRQLS